MADDFINKIGIDISGIDAAINKASSKLGGFFRDVEKPRKLKVDAAGVKDDLYEIEQINQKLKKSDAIKGMADDFDKAGRELDDFINENKRALAQMKILGKGGSSQYKKIENELKDATQKAHDFDKALSEIDESVDVKINVEQTGGGGDFLKKGGAIAGGVAAGGIAAGAFAIKEAFDFQKEISQVRLLTDETGAAADKIASTIKGVSNVFDQDFNETLIATNTLAKQMNIPVEQAADLIKRGFATGADASGEFISQLKEYPAFFQQAGLSAEQSIALMSQTAKQGIFSDKGVDVIKEATIRLNEMTSATSDALKPLGAEANKKIQEAVAGGDTFKAIQLVSEGLEDLSLTAQEKQTVIADVFGGPGEDAGLKYLLTLKDINLSLTDMEKNADPFVQQQLSLVEIQEKLYSVLADLGSAIIPAIQPILDLLTNVLAPKLAEIFQSITPLLSSVVESLGPILESLIDLLLPVFENLVKALTPIITKILELAKKAFPALNKILAPILEQLPNLADILGQVLDAATPLIEALIDELADILSELLTALLPPLIDLLKSLLPVIKLVTTVVLAFQKGLYAIYGVVLDFLLPILKKLIEGVNAVAEPISGAAGAVTGFLSDIGLIEKQADPVIAKLDEITQSFLNVAAAANKIQVEKAADQLLKLGNKLKTDAEKKLPAGKKKKTAVSGGSGSTSSGLGAELNIDAALLDLNKAGITGGEIFTDAFYNELNLTTPLQEEVKAWEKQREKDANNLRINELLLGAQDDSEKYFAELNAKYKQSQDKIRAEIEKTLELNSSVITDVSKNISKTFGNLNFDIDFNNENAKKALDEINNKEDEIVKSLKRGEITYEEYARKINALDEERAGLQTGFANQFVEIWKSAAKQVSASFAEMANQSKLAITQIVTDNQERAERIKVIDDKIKNKQYSDYTEYQALLEEKQIAETDANKATQEAYEQTAVIAGASFAQMILDGENAGKAFVLSALDALQALVPVLIAEIFGQSIGQLGPIAGPLVSGGLIAAFQGLVGLAKSAVKSGFSVGGDVKEVGNPIKTASDTIPAWLTPGEHVWNVEKTKTHRELLSHIDAGGTEIDYFYKKYGFQYTGKNNAAAMNTTAQNGILSQMILHEQLKEQKLSNEILTEIAKHTKGMRGEFYKHNQIDVTIEGGGNYKVKEKNYRS